MVGSLPHFGFLLISGSLPIGGLLGQYGSLLSYGFLVHFGSFNEVQPPDTQDFSGEKRGCRVADVRL